MWIRSNTSNCSGKSVAWCDVKWVVGGLNNWFRQNIWEICAKQPATLLLLLLFLYFSLQKLSILTMQEPPCSPKASSQTLLRISWKMFMVRKKNSTKTGFNQLPAVLLLSLCLMMLCWWRTHREHKADEASCQTEGFRQVPRVIVYHSHSARMERSSSGVHRLLPEEWVCVRKGLEVWRCCVWYCGWLCMCRGEAAGGTSFIHSPQWMFIETLWLQNKHDPFLCGKYRLVPEDKILIQGSSNKYNHPGVNVYDSKVCGP